MPGESQENVRIALAARIAALDVRAPYATVADMAAEVDAIRRIAHRHGMAPAVTVAHFLDHALARGERGPLLHGWLAMLDEAVASGRDDLDAAHAFAAACSVRLAA
ncbi:hypothetical protein [uncultured Sphingomonas sp.]|uniref:hypothetical protein n=1 Tax=Sphingomonas sp. TaxID=28214 RepID=UPI002607B1BB|nr:hypothetical protein [uncultured Sphingomonas sp.]